MLSWRPRPAPSRRVGPAPGLRALLPLLPRRHRHAGDRAVARALAALTAAVGGTMLANVFGVSSEVGNVGLRVFPVVILGGIDSIAGAVVGGAVIGKELDADDAEPTQNLQGAARFHRRALRGTGGCPLRGRRQGRGEERDHLSGRPRVGDRDPAPDRYSGRLKRHLLPSTAPLSTMTKYHLIRSCPRRSECRIAA